MKVFALFLTCVMLLGMLAGCRSNVPQETDGHIVPTDDSTGATLMTELTVPTMPVGMAESDSAKILQKIWDQYPENERFAVYGGAVEQSVADAPGDLDMSMTEELTTRYLLPEDQLQMVEEGASLVHLMNNNIFTAAVFRVKENPENLAKSWRSSIMSTRWICGQPDRLIMARPMEGYLLMAFGSQDAMSAFKNHLTAAFPAAHIVYEEAIVA
ncbi:MAG: hypothetical protein E7448_06590 [Ruminococcaceae bacterium]|nr:hypothetical protein [Oscillospiraceae bacterium]